MHPDRDDDEYASPPPDTEPPLWRSRIAVSVVLVCAVVLGTWWLFRWLTGPSHNASPSNHPPIELEAHDPSAAPGEYASATDGHQPQITTAEATVFVHVAGAVHRPGVYELPASARAIDALNAAGGATADALLDGINLAAILTDGQQLLVPDTSAPAVAAGAGNGTEAGGAAAPGGGTATVNINTADQAELETLPGVGPATAQKILTHRETHGPFTRLEDLDAISGIGPATLERLDGLVSW